jgi:hypothetical protein
MLSLLNKQFPVLEVTGLGGYTNLECFVRHSSNFPFPLNQNCFLLPSPKQHRGYQDAEWLITSIAELEVCAGRDSDADARARLIRSPSYSGCIPSVTTW